MPQAMPAPLEIKLRPLAEGDAAELLVGEQLQPL